MGYLLPGDVWTGGVVLPESRKLHVNYVVVVLKFY